MTDEQSTTNHADPTSVLHSLSAEDLESAFRYESYEGLTTRSLCRVCRKNTARGSACKLCLLVEKMRRLMT